MSLFLNFSLDDGAKLKNPEIKPPLTNYEKQLKGINGGKEQK